MESVFGFPREVPQGIDFATFSNEDLNFIATLAAGTNDSLTVAKPYPSSMNLWEEVQVIHRQDFGIHQPDGLNTGTSVQRLRVHLSMLNKTPTVSWFGDLADVDDEFFKAQYYGPIDFGGIHANITAVASVEGTQRTGQNTEVAVVYPPRPMPLMTPQYITFTTQNKTATLATNAIAEADYSLFERVYLRDWFTIRRMTSDEIRFLNRLPTRFQQLDS